MTEIDQLSTYHVWVFYKTDPVFFVKSTKIGNFSMYGYTEIKTFRDPWMQESEDKNCQGWKHGESTWYPKRAEFRDISPGCDIRYRETLDQLFLHNSWTNNDTDDKR